MWVRSKGWMSTSLLISDFSLRSQNVNSANIAFLSWRLTRSAASAREWHVN
jgi:hypothetical protein